MDAFHLNRWLVALACLSTWALAASCGPGSSGACLQDSQIVDADSGGRTLGASDCSEYIVEEPVTLSDDLTIEPGVELIFEQDAGILMEDGAINAEGTEDEPIVLRGADSMRGFWEGIGVESRSSDNIFEHVTIENAGCCEWTGADDTQAALWLGEGGRLEVRNSTLRENANYALQVEDEEANLADFTDNEILDNDAAARLHPEQVASLGSGNSISDNEGGILVGKDDFTLPVASGGTWRDHGVPYQIVSPIDIEADVELQEGVTARFGEDANFDVRSDGSLHAAGSEEAPIALHGTDDDVGFWQGVRIGSDSSSNALEHTEIAHAGSKKWTGAEGSVAALFVADSSTVTLDMVDIRDSGGHGIMLYADAASDSPGGITECTDVTFENIDQDDIRNEDDGENACE